METFTFPEMTPELQAYLTHSEGWQTAEDSAVHRKESAVLKDRLPEGLLRRYRRAKLTWDCRDGTESKEPRILMSPSGKYQLHLTCHSTKPGSWAYTKGKVYQNGELIGEVCRNYSSFPNLFVEGHPNGHDYLVAGEDYQGQTVLELDTGKRRDELSEGTDEGHGFCWSSHEFDEKSQLLVVNGCHWACPYEYRLYDFSNPMGGWPELSCEDQYMDSDYQSPVIDGDTIRTFDTTFVNEEDEEDEDLDDPTKAPRNVKAIKTFRREGPKLIFVEEWVSEEEQQTRKDREEGAKRYEAWKTEFKATDPLYHAYLERVKDPWLTPEDYMSTGITYGGWCPDFKEEEARWCRRIHKHKGKKGWTLDFEWAVKILVPA